MSEKLDWALTEIKNCLDSSMPKDRQKAAEIVVEELQAAKAENGRIIEALSVLVGKTAEHIGHQHDAEWGRLGEAVDRAEKVLSSSNALDWLETEKKKSADIALEACKKMQAQELPKKIAQARAKGIKWSAAYIDPDKNHSKVFSKFSMADWRDALLKEASSDEIIPEGKPSHCSHIDCDWPDGCMCPCSDCKPRPRQSSNAIDYWQGEIRKAEDKLFEKIRGFVIALANSNPHKQGVYLDLHEGLGKWWKKSRQQNEARDGE